MVLIEMCYNVSELEHRARSEGLFSFSGGTRPGARGRVIL